MSKVVDERVVEMRFDNKQFESNVAQSMSTLQKLKQSLKFKGASDGIENLNRAAKKVDFSPMSNAADAVAVKISHKWATIQHQIDNYFDKFVASVNRMAKSLTIDQLSAGWNKYEQKTASVQTIMNATGLTIDQVNEYLDKLMWYSDETSYGFTDMTQSLGQLTSAGGDIEKLIPMIMGIANATAFAGKGAGEFSRAIYNLNQSYSAGYLQYMDWKSLDLAGVSSKQLKQTFIDTAIALGRLDAEGRNAAGTIVKLDNFGQTLQDKWADTEVMEQAFGKWSELTTAAYEAVQAGEYDTASEAIAALADQYDTIAAKGFSAAQEAKSFTEAIDATKDAVSSGWLKTFELIFGNYEEAKKLWTELANFLWDVFASGAEIRNEILGSALGRGFTELSGKFKELITPAKKAMDTVANVKDTLLDLDEVVSKVIRGDFGNGKTRYDALTEAGYNWYVVQNKVNETLGCSKRYTQEQIDAQNELLGVQNKLVGVQDESVDSVEELDKSQKRLLISRIKMKEEDLEALGYTEDQIAAFKELGETAKKLGIPLSEFIDNIDEINGRWLLINSFKNIGRALVKVFSSIGRAWKSVFKPITSDKIFDVIAAFHKFTTQLTRTYNVVPKLTRTFKGLFSLLHIISTIAGGGLRLVFSIIARLMKSMGLSILDVTAKLGDAITKFHDFIFENELITKGFDKLAEGIEWVSEKITSLFDTIANSKFVKTVGEAFKELYDIWFGKGGETEDANNLSSAIGTVSGALSDLNSDNKASVFSTISEGINAIAQLANTKWSMSLTSGLKILNAVLELFGTNLARIGEDVAPYIIKLRDWVKENTFLINTNGKIAVVLKALIDGIKKCADAFMALKPVQKIIEKIRKLISDLFGDVSNGINGITTSGLEKIFDTISKWISGLENSENLGLDIVKGLANGIKAAAKWVVDAILNLGQTIIVTFKELLGIASPSWIFYILGVFVVLGLAKGIEASSKFVKEAVSFLAAEIIGFFKSEGLANFFKSLKNGLLEFYYFIKGYLTKFANFVSTLNFKQIFMSMIPIGAVIISLKKLYDIADAIEDGIKGVNKVVDSFGGLLKSGSNVLNAYANTFKSKNLMRMAISIAILAASLIALTFVDPDKLWNAAVVLGVIAGILILLAKAMNELDAASATFTKKDGLNISGLKSGLIEIGAALLLIAASVKMIGSMNPEEATQGFVALGAMALGLILMVSVFSVCAKLLGANAEAIKSFGSSIFMISLGMLLMVKAVKMIAEISWEDLIKGGVVLGAFTIFIGILAICLLACNRSMTVITSTEKGFISSSKGFVKIGGTILAIAFSMLIMIAAMKLIGTLSAEEILAGLTVLGAYLLFIGLFTRLINVVTKKTTKNGTATERAVAKIGGMLISIAVSMLLMVAVCKLAGKLTPSEMLKGIAFAALFLVFIKVLVKLTTISNVQKTAKVASTILAFSIAIAVMVGLSILLGMLSLEQLAKGVAAVSILAAMMALMVRAAKGTKDIAKTITQMAIAIGVMTAAAIGLGFIPEENLKRGVGALVLLMLSFAAMEKALPRRVSKNMWKSVLILSGVVILLAGILYAMDKLHMDTALNNVEGLAALMLSFAVSMRIMAGMKSIRKSAMKGMAAMLGITIVLGGILWAFSKLNVSTSLSNVAGLSVLMLAFAVSMRIMAGMKGVSKSAIAGMATMGLITVGLAGILIWLSKTNTNTAASNVAGLSVLMLAFAVSMRIMAGMKGISKTAIEGMIAMSAVTIILALVLAAFSNLNVTTSLSNVAGLSVLMLAFAVSMRIMAGMKGISKTAIEGMIAMSAVTIILALVLAAFSNLNVTTSLSNVAGLSVLMLAFAVSMRIMAGMKGISKTAIEGMIAMSAVTIILALVLAAFSNLNVTTSLSNVAGLSVLMLAFAVSMRIMAGMEGISKTAIEGMIAMSAVTIILALVLAGLSKLEVDIAFETALSLSVLLLAFAGVTVILSKFGPVASTAAAGALAMSAVVGVLGGLIVAIGALCTSTKFSKLEEFLDKGISILEKIGTGIGSFLGGFVSGLTSGVAYSITRIGYALSAFMAGAEGFIEGIKNVDPNMASTVGVLCDAILSLTGAGILDALLGRIGTPIEEIGSQLAGFAEGVVAFSDALKEGDFDSEKVKAAAEVGMAMADLQDAIDPVGGILQKLTGVGDLSDFGEQIKDYAAALIATCGALSLGDGTSCLKADLIREAADVGMAMADLQGAISPVGGILQELIGVGDLSDFGEQIKDYGAALVAASGALSLGDGTSAIHADIIREAADAGMAMADLQGAISPVGGILQELIGVGDLSNFGKQIKEYGAALVAASGALTLGDGTSAIHPEAIEDAATAGMTLAGLQGSIKPIGGIVQDIMGVTDLGDFGKQIKTYFEQLKIASESLTGEDGTININNDAIQTAVDAGKKLAILQRYIPEDTWFDGKTNLAQFGEKIVSFGAGISDFSTSLADLNVDNMTAGITAANRLATLAKRLVDIDTSGITKFKSVKSIGTVIKDYYGEVMNISPDILESSVGSAIRLKNMVAGLVSVDPSGIENFKVDGIGEAIKSYYNKVSSIDTTLLYLSITNATRLRDFITSLIGFDGGGVASFVEALDTLGTADLQSVIAAFSSGAEEMFSIGQNFINNFLTGIQQSQVLLTNMFVTTISLIFSTIRNTGTSFVAAGRYIMTRFANGMRTQVRYVTTAATSSLSNAVRSIRLYYSNFKDAGRYLGQGLIDGMNAKQQETYNAGHALGKISAKGVKDGAQEQSPSKLTTQYGEYLGEGLVIGMGNTLGAVYKQGKELGKGAATSVYNALNGAADAANVDYTPSIRPVVDLTSFRQNTGNLQIGADISSRLLSGPVNSLQQIVANAQSDITASNNEVIKAINGLREDLNMYYSSDDKEIALYMDTKKVASTIAKPMNRELNILAKRGAY